MAVGDWHRVDHSGRSLLPFGVTIGLMLLGMTPLHLPVFSTVAPPLGMMAVFYWAIHRPDLLRPSIVFLIGVLHDMVSGTPLGMTALVFVLVYWVVLSNRRFFLGTSFLMLWWGFSMVAMGAAAVQWAAYSLIAANLLDIKPAGFQALVAIAIFPLPAWLLMRIHRAYLNEGG